jgi:hypothetical protein
MNLSVARNICLALGMTLLPGTSAASDQDIRWNGFLNIVAGTLRDAPDDESGPTQHQTYRGYTDAISLDEQTSAALQAVKPLDDNMTVTAQLLARGNNDNYSAEMRWLYLSWQPGNDDLLRVGRIGTPFYYFSDFLDVGYSYHWVTPPMQVYTFNTTLTGINYLRRGVAGHFEWSMEFMAGAQNQFVPDIEPLGAQVDIRNARMVVLETTSGGWLTLRTMFYRAKTSFTIADLTPDNVLDAAMDSLVSDGTFDRNTADNVVRPLLAPVALPAIERDINLEDIDIRYKEYAVRAEQGSLIAMAEWIEFDTHSYLLGKPHSWFITAGWRMGRWTPYLTRSRTKGELDQAAQTNHDSTLAETASLTEQATDIAGQATSRIAASIAEDENETSVGVRYEASDFTAIKMEAGLLDSHATVPDETDYVGDNLILRAGLNVTF